MGWPFLGPACGRNPELDPDPYDDDVPEDWDRMTLEEAIDSGRYFAEPEPAR